MEAFKGDSAGDHPPLDQPVDIYIGRDRGICTQTGHGSEPETGSTGAGLGMGARSYPSRAERFAAGISRSPPTVNHANLHSYQLLALRACMPLAPQEPETERWKIDIARRQAKDWVIPRLMGNVPTVPWLRSSPNVVSVRHAFIGSSQLALPWIYPQFVRGGAVARGTTWVVMPYYPTDLKQVTQFAVETGRRISDRQAALWLLQILQGVEHARSRGIAHRDLKADNVFLTADGRAVVADFGDGLVMFQGGRMDEMDRMADAMAELEEGGSMMMMMTRERSIGQE